MKIEITHRIGGKQVKAPAGSSSLLARTAGDGFGLANQVSIGDLLDTRVAKQTFIAIAKELNITKMTLDVLSIAFGLPQSKIELNKVVISPEQEELANVICQSIEDEKDQSAREELWDMCDSVLKYQMLLPEIDHINLDLYSLLDLDGNTVRKAFLRKVAYVAPKEGRASLHYGELDEFIAEQLKTILSKLPKADAEELLLSMNPKVLFLLTNSEIGRFTGDGDSDRVNIIRCAYDYYDSIPSECVLLSWIQENIPVVYKRLLYSLKNNEYAELRSVFYEEDNIKRATEKLIDAKETKKYIDEKHAEINEIEGIIDNMDSIDKREE